MTTLQTRPQTANGVLRALEREAQRDSERRTQERADLRVTCSGEATRECMGVTYAPAASLVRRKGKLVYESLYWYWWAGVYLSRTEALALLKETVSS